ncbi:MAG: PilZ domain-containing protein [Alphaproteobacteria bacterium]|nr:PilZ domain-containing protein [Alphaproteobacteria bacterium]
MTALQAQVTRRPSSQLRMPDVDFGDRHRTVELALQGRFMRTDKSEYPAKMIRISVAEMQMTSPVLLAPKEKVVAYFEHIGLIDGAVDRVFESGFSMCLNITTRKREKLAAQLTWLINRSEFTGLEGRRHERIAVGNKPVTMQLGERAVQCALLDISLSGASLGTHFRPVIGTEVVVGMQHAVVRRHHDHGIGVQFLQVQEANALQTLFD